MVLNTQTIMRSISKTSQLHIWMWIYAIQSAPLLPAFCYIKDACKCYSGINRFWHRKKLALFMLGNFSWLFCHLLIFLKIIFYKKSLRNTIRVSNGLNPDQDWHSVSSDLGPNHLQRLSADNKHPYLGIHWEFHLAKRQDSLRKAIQK